MIDAALIEKCADPSLRPAIVERFVAAAGSTNPLAITVRVGERVVLISPPRSSDEAMDLVRRYVGQAVVRVGVTQYPAGVGITDVSELSADLVEPCGNLRVGTALFAKVYRIVVRWYGSERPEAFEDAIEAWRTGQFEGKAVFAAPDPGPLETIKAPVEKHDGAARSDFAESPKAQDAPEVTDDPHRAGIRVDLSRIGAKGKDDQ